ncbi:hypothetical protein Ptr902_07806 [Pyrenophora tritici-repentis]|nr:hypothetical protein Ptr902_07806 [Pyrenophora tritici-repentis]
MYVVATLPLPWAFVLVVGVLGPASVTTGRGGAVNEDGGEDADPNCRNGDEDNAAGGEEEDAAGGDEDAIADDEFVWYREFWFLATYCE